MSKTTKPRLMGVLPITLSITLIACAVSAESAPGQVDQGALAKQLLGTDLRLRNRALAQVEALGPGNASEPLRAALIRLLERENDVVLEARKRGVGLATLEDPEFISALSRTVGELRDPQAISAMAGAMGMFTLIRPLADFGQLAAPSVLRVVMSPESHYTAVDDGLRILRFMVEKRQTRPLSADTLGEIRRAARQRLTGKQYFTTLWYAIDLAMVLDDEGLKRIVESFANDPQAIRGVVEPDVPDVIDRTGKRVQDRLAGVPALPRPD